MQIAAGVPLVTVAARAGHARPSTTTDNQYGHTLKQNPKQTKFNVKKFDRASIEFFYKRNKQISSILPLTAKRGIWLMDKAVD